MLPQTGKDRLDPALLRRFSQKQELTIFPEEEREAMACKFLDDVGVHYNKEEIRSFVIEKRHRQMLYSCDADCDPRDIEGSIEALPQEFSGVFVFEKKLIRKHVCAGQEWTSTSKDIRARIEKETRRCNDQYTGKLY